MNTFWVTWHKHKLHYNAWGGKTNGFTLAFRHTSRGPNLCMVSMVRLFCTAGIPWMSAKVFAISPPTTRPIYIKPSYTRVRRSSCECVGGRDRPSRHHYCMSNKQPCGRSHTWEQRLAVVLPWRYQNRQGRQCGRTEAVFAMVPSHDGTPKAQDQDQSEPYIRLLSSIVWDKLWRLCNGSGTRRIQGKEVHYTHSNSLDRYKNYTSNDPFQVLLK